MKDYKKSVRSFPTDKKRTAEFKRHCTSLRTYPLQKGFKSSILDENIEKAQNMIQLLKMSKMPKTVDR